MDRETKCRKRIAECRTSDAAIMMKMRVVSFIAFCVFSVSGVRLYPLRLGVSDGTRQWLLEHFPCLLVASIVHPILDIRANGLDILVCSVG